MEFRFENENGNTITAASGINRQIMLQSYDFGSITEDVQAAKIYGIDGETYMTSNFGIRDITITFMNIAYSPHLIQAALSPKTKCRMIINNQYYIDGKVVGTASVNRPAYNVSCVYGVTFRAFDPYFYKIGGDIATQFANNGGTATNHTIFNSGEVDCPITVKFQPTTSSRPTLALNDSATDIIKMASGFTVNGYYTYTTDKSKIASLLYLDMDASKLFTLPVGNSKLSSTYCNCTVTISPRFLNITEV